MINEHSLEIDGLTLILSDTVGDQFSSITVKSFRALFRRLVVLTDPNYLFPTS
jgi:hypothetical protein